MTFKTQQRFPLSARNVSAIVGSPDEDWTNPTFATSADASAATVTINTFNDPRNSNYLLFQRFGFSAAAVPSLGSIISYNIITSAFSTGTLPTLTTFLDDDPTPNDEVATNTLTSADATYTNNITPTSAVDFGGELSALTVAQRVEATFAFPNVAGTVNLGSTSLQIEYVFGRVTANGVGASSGGGTNSWSTPQQVTASDNVYASQTVTVTASNQDFLDVTNFGFSIPTGSTIIGIKADIEVFPSANTSFNNVQIIKGGVRGGNNLGSSSSFFANSGDITRQYGNERTLWGNSLSPGDVNASNFGVSIRAISQTGSHTVKIDNVKLVIFYDTNAEIGVNNNEYGFEAQSVSLERIYNVSPGSSEYGVEIQSVSPRTHTPDNKYGFEAQSVQLNKNIVVQSSEYGYEGGSPTLVQTHVVSPASSEYGVEIQSNPLFDPGWEKGFEMGGPSLVQTHSINVQSSEYAFEQDLAINMYDSTRSPGSSEYGYEIGSVAVARQVDLNVLSLEFGYESSSPGFKVFGPGTGNSVSPGPNQPPNVKVNVRRAVVRSESRRLIIPADYN